MGTDNLKVERVSISSLRKDPDNARKHSQKNIDAIAGSLSLFGQRRPLVVWGDVIIAGNGTVEAAESLGWEDVHITRVPDDWSRDQARAYALADNRTAELAEWDKDVLATQLVELDDAGYEIGDWGFDPLEDDGGGDNPIVDDDLSELISEPVVNLGDIWQLGSHRIMCGDCREPSQVEALLGGNTMNLAVTSPPYAEQRTYDESSGFRPIHPDEYVEWFSLVASNVKNNLSADGSWIVNIKPASKGMDTELYVFDLVLAHVRRWGWHLGAEFCWERVGVPGKPVRRFKNQFEPIYQFALGEWKFRPESVQTVGKAAFKYEGIEKDWKAKNDQGKKGERNKLSDREIKEGLTYPGNRLPTFSGTHEALGHGAAFPVGLPEFFIKAYTDTGDNVYDPFLGSGSTILAAENTGRTGYGMELSPTYCDIILARWERVTGIAPKKLETR